jgi:two-component system, OmpR family, copper resistance phosphate regulon response regulator CusR
MRILVVEDQKKMLEFIKKGLTEVGYAVDQAASGGSAESLASEHDYDLIVLDVMLPDQTGFDTARNLRRDGFSGPILMLTALGDTKDKVKGLDAGADDYLTKPFDFAELLARIRALLRRFSDQGAGITTQLRFADLEMNLLTREVLRGSQKITLTQKEFALLEYLLRNATRPVTRTSIAEHVWDIHYDTGSNVIDVCVNTLRKKVDAGFPKRLIQTVIGIGYMIKEEE